MAHVMGMNFNGYVIVPNDYLNGFKLIARNFNTVLMALTIDGNIF